MVKEKKSQENGENGMMMEWWWKGESRETREREREKRNQRKIREENSTFGLKPICL